MLHQQSIVGLAIAFLCWGHVHADSKSHLSLGFGVNQHTSAYVGQKDETRAYPHIELQWSSLYLKGAELGWKLVETKPFGLSVSVTNDVLNGRREDSAQLRDLGDVKKAINAKIQASYQTYFGTLAVSAMTDVSDTHDGQSAELSWSKHFPMGQWTLAPKVSTTWLSEEITGHYYGVTPAQQQRGRSPYQPEAGSIQNLQLSVLYTLNRHWTLLGRVEKTFLDESMSDSPILDKERTQRTLIGAFYRF